MNSVSCSQTVGQCSAADFGHCYAFHGRSVAADSNLWQTVVHHTDAGSNHYCYTVLEFDCYHLLQTLSMILHLVLGF